MAHFKIFRKIFGNGLGQVPPPVPAPLTILPFVQFHSLSILSVPFHSIKLHYTTLDYIIHPITSHHILSQYINLHQLTSHDSKSCYITWHYMTISHCITSHCIKLQHITLLTLHDIKQSTLHLHQITCIKSHHNTLQYITLHNSYPLGLIMYPLGRNAVALVEVIEIFFNYFVF